MRVSLLHVKKFGIKKIMALFYIREVLRLSCAVTGSLSFYNTPQYLYDGDASNPPVREGYYSGREPL